MMDPNTEIRKLRPAELYTLSRILAALDSWKMLMAVVPKEGTENEPRFNTEHFALIEQASSQQRKSGAEIFLEEWSTMGKQRPTLQSTLDLLVKAQLFRAADYIAVDLLKKQPPERPTSGPAAPIDISDEEIAKLMQLKNSEFENSDSQSFESKESLEHVLDGFNYPSQLSEQSVNDNQERRPTTVKNSLHHHQQRMGLELANEISTLRICPENNNQMNSNLMQFSKSNVEESDKNNHQNPTHYSDSNLIHFSSNNNTNTTDHSDENCPLINGVQDSQSSNNDVKAGLRRQNITHSNSSNSEGVIKEGNRLRIENIETNDSPSCAGFNNEPISNSDNYKEFELQSSELPAFVAEIGKGSTLMYSELKSSELPQFVVDITRQGSIRESFEEATISSDSNSTDTSSNFLTDVTSQSNNETETNIPICVNRDFPSGKLANNELVSAELPQFVAELGHRRNDDSSHQSSNDHFQYIYLNSQELPLVVSECNKNRSSVEENIIELQSAELPQCVAELQSVIKR